MERWHGLRRRANLVPVPLRVLVFQHIAVEHPGVFRDFFAQDGIDWDAIELDEGETIPDLQGYDILMVMGGPMDVWEETAYPWLVEEKQAIRAWIEAGRPFLGFCLGHQLLAAALVRCRPRKLALWVSNSRKPARATPCSRGCRVQ